MLTTTKYTEGGRTPSPPPTTFCFQMMKKRGVESLKTNAFVLFLFHFTYFHKLDIFFSGVALLLGMCFRTMTTTTRRFFTIRVPYICDGVTRSLAYLQEYVKGDRNSKELFFTSNCVGRCVNLVKVLVDESILSTSQMHQKRIRHIWWWVVCAKFDTSIYKFLHICTSWTK